MPNTRLGKVSVTPRGDFLLGTAYDRLDIVYSDADKASYLAKRDNKGVPLTDRDSWMPLAQGVQGIQGIQGEKGEPFQIQKSYADAAEMEADFANDEIGPGQFVVIDAGDVDQPDNGKLYRKGASAWEFVIDMSGPTGVQGPKGDMPTIQAGTVTTGQPGTKAAVSIDPTDTGVSVSFTIPEGEKGSPLKVAGSYDTIEELEAAFPDGDGENSYLVSGIIHVWDKTGWKGTGGVDNYEVLRNKPRIGGVDLNGDKTLEELGIQSKSGHAEDVQKLNGSISALETGKADVGHSHTKTEVGLGNVDDVRQYSASNPPPYPVKSVAGKTGAVTLSKSDVGLSSVDNVRQYSASNPPPYPVTSIAGRTGAVTLSKSDVGLSSVDNVKQYSASNPPPYPVTSVAGRTGKVVLTKTDVGLGNVDNVKQYSANNPPPYPVTSVVGKTGAVALTKSDVGLSSVDNVKQYSASNPPPYPVTSVAGMTGAVTGVSKATNILNGAAAYSIRTSGAAAETSDYKLGEYAFAEGNNTKASESYSHAEGWGSASSGVGSHAEGGNTIASEMFAHAEGYGTIASAQNSHAEGDNTKALGYRSHAAGYNTIAKDYQTVVGKCNVENSAPSVLNTAGSIFIVGNGTSDSARSNAFRVQTNGQVFSKGNYSTSGADYAELFEWEDGNPNKEDRRGHFVALRGNKIHIAKPGEAIIGVISSTAAMIGNNHSETWQGMYLTDIWGEVLTEYKEFPAEYVTIKHPAELGLDEDGNEIVLKEAWEEAHEVEPEFKGQVPILNPDYNPDEKYIPRHERQEWGIVGLLGQLIVIDDGTSQVDGYCTCTENGTATAAEKGYRVIERLDSSHIRVLASFLNM